MSLNRRRFVKSSLIAGAGLIVSPGKTLKKHNASIFLGIHPFIIRNPDAVFIIRTNINYKTNSSAIREAGLAFGNSVFGLTEDSENGIPLTHKIVIKPNLTCRSRGSYGYSIERSMGIVTDTFFVEGIINRIKELGFSSEQFYIREVNCPDDLEDGGYPAMAQRTGIDLQAIDTPVKDLSPDKVQWKEVPGGICFKRIPYLWPVNAPDTFLLNIAKLKAHSMGLTLCAKNLQGTIAMNYQAHCKSFGETMPGVNPGDLYTTANDQILANYNRHKTEGIPRWDKPGSEGGLWQETWATRCLDNNSVTHAGLHIIEGIYGRDGNFMAGPDQNGLASDYMTNFIIFGRNPFHVDIIGHYLGGHEPGNFGLFHMAMERNMASTINPLDIPFYEWLPEIGPQRASVGRFHRYPLKTCYLQRDYNGQDEPYWHLVDEHYDYGPTAVNNTMDSTDGLLLYQNFPNPINKLTSIVFQVPSHGNVLVEILNDYGNVVEVLVNSNMYNGCHLLSWDSSLYPSGMYFCRLHFAGFTKIQKMIVLH